jgi:tetratricopeptide (TPR) repeat protein
VDWGAIAERQSGRFDQAGKPVLRGNAAYGAGLALLMAGRPEEARAWFEQAASAWRESWSDATPTSWGRPIGAIKALLLAGDDEGASAAAEWALSLGCEQAESPIGRYAAALALLTLGRFDDARRTATSLRERDDFPHDVADALAFVAAHDPIAYAEAADSILTSFETRDEYLEDVAVADTLLALQALAARRGIAADLTASPVLPA